MKTVALMLTVIATFCGCATHRTVDASVEDGRSTAADAEELDRAAAAVTNALPSGWILIERKPDETPFGHHWGQTYSGPKGVLLIAKGLRSVNSEFLDSNGKWLPTPVGTESLNIWLMPRNYSESPRPLFHAPIQPTVVRNRGPVKVYARPSSVESYPQQFKELLSKSKGVRSPDSPWNSPASLTWKDWRLQLSEAFQKEFGK